MQNQVREATGLMSVPVDRVAKSESVVRPMDNDEFVTRHVEEILNLLRLISDSNGSVGTNFQRPPVEVLLHRKRLQLSKEHYKLPKFPSAWTGENLITYLRRLTSRDFAAPEYSGANINGLVPSIVKDLLRITNPLTIHAHSVEAYNIAIAYFIRLRDLLTARELFAQLNNESDLTPNTDTFNLLILSSRHRYSRKYHANQHPLEFIRSLLQKMAHQGIPLDSQTWNGVLLCTPTPDAKSHILQEMQQRSVPLSRRGLAEVMRDVIKISGAQQAMHFLQKQQVYSVTVDCINLIVGQLAAERKYHQVWHVLDYSERHWNLYPNTSTLNIILEALAPRVRFDWMLGVFGGMMHRWSVQPDATSYRHLFQVACRRNYHRRYFSIIQMVYAQYCINSDPNVVDPQMGYLVRYAKSKASFYKSVVGITNQTLTLDPTPTPHHSTLWTKAIQVLKWDSCPIVHYTAKTCSPEYRKMASYLIGFDPLLLNPSRPDHQKHYHRFYAKRYKSQWKRHTTRMRERSQQAQRQIDSVRRDQVAAQGPYQHYLAQLKHEKIIE